MPISSGDSAQSVQPDSAPFRALPVQFGYLSISELRTQLSDLAEFDALLIPSHISNATSLIVTAFCREFRETPWISRVTLGSLESVPGVKTGVLWRGLLHRQRGYFMWVEESTNFAASALLDDWVLSGRPTGSDDIRCIMLRPLPFQVGRRPGLSLQLPANTVSALHAEFFLVGSKLCLRDLGSTNGTFVNGDRLTEVRELHDNDMIQFSDLPFRLTRSPIADLSHTRTKNAVDQALAIVQFDRLIAGRGVVPHYQPIVELATGRTVAFEVLARSRLVGLESPALMFSAANQLGLSADLSQLLRHIAVEDSYRLQDVTHLFLNTHPSELDTGTLLHSCEELRRISPRQPLTIEMHEAAMTNVDQMIKLRHGLDQLDITLAFDDFGAGQARILEIAAVRPHYVKFDRCMVHDLHTDSSRRRVVATLVKMILEVGIIPLAECVESNEEAQACIDAGFVLSQGYLHGKPMPAAHYINMLHSTQHSPAGRV